MLSLPAISYLGEFMETVDIDGLYQAREAVRAAVGQALDGELRQVYEAMRDEGEYRPTPGAIGRRSLKNRVLAYLMAAGDVQGGQLCESQYSAQHNMTDVMAALALLADSEHPSREQVLADFEARWQAGSAGDGQMVRGTGDVRS